MNKLYDCVVIGAGVVGISIFNKLTLIGKKCLMIDKASDVATGCTKANSGIVHAGYDPVPGSLKATLNVRGNFLYPQICKRLGVKLNQCGALIVGDDKQKIKALFERGKQNGVVTEIWDKQQIKDKVPGISENITVGLFAPTSCVVSPYYFAISLADEAVLNGGEVSLEEDIFKVSQKDIFEIETNKGTYFAKTIVNCAGFGYNDVANILGSENYPLEFRRGEYFVFDKNYHIDAPMTIFPLPTKLGKGVLVTPTADGNFLVGPTSEVSDTLAPTTLEGLDSIKEKAKLILPNINFKYAIRQFAGVRVICGDDFVIEKSKKVDGVINVTGICSPGLTSAPAIAEYVVKLLGFSIKEKSNLKRLPKYTSFKDLPKAKQKEILESDPSAKDVVCVCENITKFDVLNALNRPIKPSTVDGIKRRTNAGMGRCQGGFCFTKVVKTIVEERGVKYEDVLKENRGSNVAYGAIREVKHD